jgi:DNA-binding NarL/FixJ family response regulator
VSDDGVGFNIEHMPEHHPANNGTSTHFGLRAMQERVEQAGGALDITSKLKSGTTIKARFPLTLSPLTLTNREHEVLRLLVDGATNRAIAGTLSVSIETVKSHVHHIMQKLQVKDRTQAAVLATRKQWV